MVDGLVDIMETWYIVQRLDIRFTNPCGFTAIGPYIIQMPELSHRHVAHTLIAHHLCAALEMIRYRHAANPFSHDFRQVYPRCGQFMIIYAET